jgi:hypothetical protein
MDDSHRDCIGFDGLPDEALTLFTNPLALPCQRRRIDHPAVPKKCRTDEMLAVRGLDAAGDRGFNGPTKGVL